ncbi:MAG: ECF-type sigma factor [Myxococcota bacterium]
MTRPGDPSLTVLLRQWSDGDPAAREAAWSQLYSRLHGIARHVLASRRRGGVGTTSLLHDAALKLMDMDIEWQDRKHFFAASARCMRFTLVDAARKQMSGKRGQGQVSVGLPEDSERADNGDRDRQHPGEILAVHEALARLNAADPDQARLVELRYFAGMTVDETAEIMGISKPTAVRRWKAARIWLKGQLAS